MRWGVLFGLLGRLLVFLGLSMVWPLLWSLYYGDDDIYALTGAIFITILCGFIMVKSTKIENEISFREGFAVVALGWVVAAVFGALPYMFYGTFTNFIDAFFESMSGFTTTGATVLTEIEAQPHGILFWRSLTHWLGGMGIIVLFIAILPQLGVGAVQLFKAEVPGPVPERIKPRIRDTAKVLWYIYVGISGIEVIALKVAGMTLYDALNHTFATLK
jgi:trk system potassium uptake protein TrkH